MGLFDILAKAVGSIGGSSSLKEASENMGLDKKCGVYRVYYEGQLMKVGKAEYGLRQRFRQYYNGEQSGALKYITADNRDDVTVSWIFCSKSEARQRELDMYDRAKKDGEKLPWSDNR
jgi:hypothetical protein